MKNVIKPIFLSTLLSVVGYSEAQIINDTYAADVTSAPVESLSVTIANSEVSVIESNTIEVGYDIDNITQSKYSIEVISYDEDIITASVNDDNIVIQAGTVDFETTVNVDVVVTSEFGTSLVSMPITVLQQPNLDLVVEDTEVSMEFLDQLYIPFTVSHDGEEELTLSIEDIEGGYEMNGWHLYNKDLGHENTPFWAPWYVRDIAPGHQMKYIISFSPLGGYEVKEKRRANTIFSNIDYLYLNEVKPHSLEE